MADFAIVDNGTVVNVVVADNEATAEAVTGGTVVVVVDGVPGVGWVLMPDGWRPPAPFPSWEWDGSVWRAPVPRPPVEAPHIWDEETLSWVEVTI